MLDSFVTLFVREVCVDVQAYHRGSTGYGTTFERADDMLWREGQVVDVLALWDSIRMQADPDRDRVVLAGALLEFLDWLVPR